MVCESVETMVVHSSCEKLCSKEEQKIEVTTDIRTWGEGGVGVERVTWKFTLPYVKVLEKTLKSPLDCKEIKPVSPKGNQS